MTIKRVISSFAAEPDGIYHFLKTKIRPGVSQEAPIFVVGPPRSGTTMLYTEIMTYQGFVGPADETGFFMTTNPYLVPMNPMPEQNWRNSVTRAKTQAELLDRAIHWYKGNFDAEYFVEKTPQHCLYYSRIFSIWPKAKIVAIVRHPLDCIASSIKNHEFIPQGSSIKNSASYWLKCARAITRMQELDRCHIIRYEDLTTNSANMDDILEFLIGKKISLLARKKPDHVFIGKKGFELLGSPINASRIGLWKEIMEPDDIRIGWKITHKIASQFGYSATLN